MSLAALERKFLYAIALVVRGLMMVLVYKVLLSSDEFELFEGLTLRMWFFHSDFT